MFSAFSEIVAGWNFVFVTCMCCQFLIYFVISITGKSLRLKLYVLFLCVSKHSSSCSHPGTCSRISVSVCVCLMWCPKWSLRWDIMVRQTYSTTQIKINKQSEVFTLNTFSFFKLCFFNEYTTWPGSQQHRQVPSLGEIR